MCLKHNTSSARKAYYMYYFIESRKKLTTEKMVVRFWISYCRYYIEIYEYRVFWEELEMGIPQILLN